MKSCSSITCLVLTLFATAVLSKSDECGLINSAQYENHEKFTQIDEYPWMARIAYNKTETSKTTFDCQAVLISQEYLITLAHCIARPRFHPYAVLLGDWNIKNSISEEDCDNASEKCSTPLLIDIAALVVHPSYNARKKENDIALLRLAHAVSFTDYIRPICLPNKDVQTKDFGAKELILTGWLPDETVDRRKQKLSVVISNQNVCREKYADKIKLEITDSLMCAVTCDQPEGIHVSGSALMDVRDELPTPRSVYLAGLLAYGTRICGIEFPDIFVRIDKHLDWIKENVH